MNTIMDENLEKDLLSGVKFAVFGLGDSSYVHFNKAAKDCAESFSRLGA
jgi:sulfite reductase alpha subunit-like flavoprotein